MGLFRHKVEEVSQIDFVERTNELLETATDSGTDVHTVLTNVQAVDSHLATIRNGKLNIVPPLTHEQLVSFEERASVISAVAQKAVSALDATAQSRETAKKPTFEGQGSDAKS
jgi:hypothetical protein